MALLALYWGIMIVSYIIASKLRDKKEKFAFTEELTNIVIYLAQAQMHRQAGGCFGCAILHRRKFHIVKPYNTVADRAVARVDAKNRHKKTSA